MLMFENGLQSCMTHMKTCISNIINTHQSKAKVDSLIPYPSAFCVYMAGLSPLCFAIQEALRWLQLRVARPGGARV